MENFINVGNGNIWTCINGNENNPTILLCNGGPGCCDYLACVSQMPEKVYKVIWFEQRGCIIAETSVITDYFANGALFYGKKKVCL